MMRIPVKPRAQKKGMMMKLEWKVGELAKLAGLTVRTLRYYDQIGLLPSGHTDSGHSIYTESDIARLQLILSMKELGLSLDQIKSVVVGDHLNLLDIRSDYSSKRKYKRSTEAFTGIRAFNKPYAE